MAKVIVINPFEVPSGKEEKALELWDKFAEYFRAQPGYVSSKLHRAISPDSRFHLVTLSEWESAEHFQTALTSDELKKLIESSTDVPPSYPGVYEVIRT